MVASISLRSQIFAVEPSWGTIVTGILFHQWADFSWALVWNTLAVMGLLFIRVLSFLGWQNREVPWMGRDAAYDQGYMRRMAAHHAQGIELAQVAIEKAHDPYLKDLAQLTAASQKGEIEVMHGTEGIEAVKAATLSLIVPAGEASADRRGEPLPAHPVSHGPMSYGR